MVEEVSGRLVRSSMDCSLAASATVRYLFSHPIIGVCVVLRATSDGDRSGRFTLIPDARRGTCPRKSDYITQYQE